MQITLESIYNRFHWAKPVDLEFDNPNKGFFGRIKPCYFNQAQLELLRSMLEEVENWYLIRNKTIEVVIFEIKEVQGHVFVEKICGFPEVIEIFDKYRAIYLGEQ